MSHPYDPDQPAQPSRPESPPPWEGGPAVPPPATPGSSAPQPPYGGSGEPYLAQPGENPPSMRSWVRRHKVLTGLGAFVLVGAIGSAFGGAADNVKTSDQALVTQPTMPPISSGQAAANSAAAGHLPVADGVDDGTATDDSTESEPTTAAPTTKAPAPPKPKPQPQPKPTPTPTPKPTPPAQPELTTGQEQAIGAAKDYLDTSAFSRAGLIEQLSSAYGSGFSKADATFAVDHLDVNWKEQAVLSAKEYLQTMHFSRAGLIQQLSSAYGSKFTRAEATYAAPQVGQIPSAGPPPPPPPGAARPARRGAPDHRLPAGTRSAAGQDLMSLVVKLAQAAPRRTAT